MPESPRDPPALDDSRSDAADIEALDRLIEVAAAALQVPVAQINTVSPDGQTSLSATGPGSWGELGTVPLDFSYCQHVVASGEPMRIEDARIHPLVRDNRATTETGVVAYAAVPLEARQGSVVGTICVVDFQPRAWSDEDMRLLEHLGRFAMAEMVRRREAEEALRRGDARFRSLVRHAPDLIIILRLDRTIVYESPSVETVLGYAPGEIEDAFALIHPDDLSIVTDAFRELTSEPGKALSVRYRYRHRSGAWRVLESTATNLLDDPAVAGVVVNSRDVTERVEAEEALRENEERYRLMIEGSAQVFFYSHDRAGRFLYLSPSLRNILGYDPEELVGKHYSELLTEDLLNARVDADTERTLEGGEAPSTYVALTRHRDGHEVPVELTESALRKDGEVVGVQGFARDIGERMRAEEELLRSRDFYLSVLEHFPTLVWRCDSEASCDYFNRTWLDFTGRTLAEEIGEGWEESVHPDDLDRAVGVFRDAVRDRQPFEVEYRLRHHTGEYRWIRNLGRPLRGPEGEFAGFIGTGFVTHEQRHLEQQLRVAQRMEGLGRLAGGIAHDFNNILGVIGGTAELLLLDLPGASEVREDVEEIKRASDRAADLTRQLLAFSRQHVLQPEIVDVNETIAGMEKLLRRALGSHIEFVTILDERLGAVEADPTQMGQMLMNLVVNARDAMPDGGKLVTETRNVEIGDGRGPDGATGGIPPGTYVMIRISDTGEGMATETQERIFDPFFTTKAPGKGTGLGLATVYGIVQQSGGFISVHSEKGKGTAFEIWLPAAENREASEPEDTADAAEARRCSGTILVAEDQAALRSVVRRSLERRGYTVLEAANGEEALRVAREEEGAIDLLLTDVVMPLMGGTDLAEAILAERPDTRVLLMSGYAADRVLEKAADRGMHVLLKPFSPSDLVARVNEILEPAED